MLFSSCKSRAHDLSHNLTVSKHNLKHALSKRACDLGFAAWQETKINTSTKNTSKFIPFKGGTVLPLALYSNRGKYGTAPCQENKRPVCVRFKSPCPVWPDEIYVCADQCPTLRYLTLPYATSRDLTLPYANPRYLTFHYVSPRYVTLRYLTLHYLTLPCLTLAYATLRYLTLPYLTVPYLTSPRQG